MTQFSLVIFVCFTRVYVLFRVISLRIELRTRPSHSLVGATDCLPELFSNSTRPCTMVARECSRCSARYWFLFDASPCARVSVSRKIRAPLWLVDRWDMRTRHEDRHDSSYVAGLVGRFSCYFYFYLFSRFALLCDGSPLQSSQYLCKCKGSLFYSSYH